MTNPMQAHLDAHTADWERQSLGDASPYLADLFGRFNQCVLAFMDLWTSASTPGELEALRAHQQALTALEAEILGYVLPAEAVERDVAQLAWAKEYIRLWRQSFAVLHTRERDQVRLMVDDYLAHRQPDETFRDWHERDKPQADRDQAIAETVGCALAVAEARSSEILAKAEAELARRTGKR